VVALSGDGGDENLAGYRRYRWHSYEERMRGLMPLGLRRPLFGTLGRLYPKADWAPKVFRAKTTFEALARDNVEGYFHGVSILRDALRARMFSPAQNRALQGYRAIEVLRGHAARAPTDHPLSLVQYLDMKTYLPGDILTKVDRASMAHALEVRVPILDHKLVEWISGLPPDLKLRGREGKYIFKKALAPYLPDDILYRRKQGFAVPLDRWFRGPLKQQLRDAVLGPVMADTVRVGRRLGIPVVYEVRAFWEDAAVDHGTSREGGPRYRATRAMETYVFRHADAVTTICEGLRGDIIGRGIPAARVTVIPNAVDIEQFRQGGEPDPELRTRLGLDDARVIGFIGSFYAYEGLSLLLDALPRILEKAPDARVLLVGGGFQDAALRQQAQKLGIADKVVFTGRVPHAEVTRYYDLVDLLVYPRLSMRLTDLVTPLKPLEAMAQGRLLLASDVGGHRELIEDAHTSGACFRAFAG
jgi:glycosyltransferase involved in cell wall biosynthesis